MKTTPRKSDRAGGQPAELRALLTGAAHYRGFLQAYFEATKLSYAEVARRGGFSSRSYPRDVTEGRRRLTAKSLPTLVRGLRLEADLARVLQLLYFAEHPGEHPENLSPEAISRRLEKARAQVARRLRAPPRKKQAIPNLADGSPSACPPIAAGLTDVLAALGTVESGSTLEEIGRKTGLPKAELAGNLRALAENQLVRYCADRQRYYPGTAHLDWTGEAGSRLAKEIFQSSVERLKSVAENHFAGRDTMFLTSAVAVPREKVAQLNAEIRELILRYVDGIADADGADHTVVQIVSGIFEGRLAPPRSH